MARKKKAAAPSVKKPAKKKAAAEAGPSKFEMPDDSYDDVIRKHLGQEKGPISDPLELDITARRVAQRAFWEGAPEHVLREATLDAIKGMLDSKS